MYHEVDHQKRNLSDPMAWPSLWRSTGVFISNHIGVARILLVGVHSVFLKKLMTILVLVLEIGPTRHNPLN